MRNHYRTTGLGLALSLGAFVSAPVGAQSVRPPNQGLFPLASPQVHGPAASQPVEPGAQSAPQATPPSDQATPPLPEWPAAWLLASVGSAIGLYAGGSWGMVAGGTSELSNEFVYGVVGGTVLGAALGGGVATDNWGRALAGSTVGALAGFALVAAFEGGGVGMIVPYALVHGGITTLFAAR